MDCLLDMTLGSMVIWVHQLEGLNVPLIFDIPLSYRGAKCSIVWLEPFPMKL